MESVWFNFFFSSSSTKQICSFLYLLTALSQLFLLGVEAVCVLVHETCLGLMPVRPSSPCLGRQRTLALGAGRLPVDHPLLDTLQLPNHAWELLGNTLHGTGPKCEPKQGPNRPKQGHSSNLTVGMIPLSRTQDSSQALLNLVV